LLKKQRIQVINTPASSSESVAELVFAHLFSGVRFLHDSNRNMPLEGDTNFDGFEKAYANGVELRGKTLELYWSHWTSYSKDGSWFRYESHCCG
jgi:D-3-phosphoglycerate dehydrogenase